MNLAGAVASNVAGLNVTDNGAAFGNSINITTNSNNGHGASGMRNATLDLSNAVISVRGPASYGISVSDASTLTFRNGSQVSTVQSFNHAAYVALNAKLTIDNSSATTQSNGAYGVFARDIGSVANVINGSSLSTQGSSAFGAVSQQGAFVNVVDSTIATAGTGAAGAYTFYGSRIDLTNTTLTTTGSGGSYAFYATGPAGAVNTFNATNSTLNSSSAATLFVNGATTNINLTGVTNNSGTNQFLIAQNSPTVDIPVDLTSPGFEAGPIGVSAPVPLLVGANPSILNLIANASVLAGSISVRGGSNAFLTLQNGTTLSGNAAADATSTLNMNLASGSTWTGAANNATNVSVDPTSNWRMTASSTVSQSLTNAGLILYSPLIGDPSLLTSYTTLTAGSYVGAGGTLGLNTFLGSDGSPSDRLIINGGSATGTSQLQISNAGGPGAVTVGNGILIVDAINGGTTAAGAFTLARPVLAGPYEYSLHRSSVDPSNAQAWYLSSTLDCTVPIAPCPTPQPGPAPAPEPVVPNFRAETSIYAAVPAMALLYGRNLLDTLHERVGEEEDQRGRPKSDQPSTGWGRVIGMTGRRDGDALGIFGSGPKYSYDFLGLQAGHDVFRREGADGSRDQAGLYFAIGRAQGSVTHITNSTTGDADFSGYTFGGYWTHFGPTGWYLDAILQGTWYDVNATAHRGIPTLRTHGEGVGASLEGGYPIKLPHGFFIEPQAQIVYQRVNLGAASDTFASVQFDNMESLAGRLGARFGRTWAIESGPAPRTMTAWIRPNFWYEFRGNPLTEFSSETGFIPFRAGLGGAWGEINLGVSGQITRAISAFANVSYDSRFEGKSYSYNGKLGIRVNW
ncbi:MAG: autotransporter outer membrane beta-barrel domain-containing protein [Bradyrhizobium sp.]|nr:autotransporter outer membrane beta-barrel domain-containing protein [Bradyrhizobium sp.]